MKPWHEQDEFWTAASQVLFPPSRHLAAIDEVEGFLELTGLPASSTVLDLCCGVGRHALLLAEKGHKVTAVDRTPAFLDQARQRAQEESLELEFVEDDMRTFCRPNTYQGALCFYTSIGFFDQEEDKKVLEHVFNSLKPGGVFAIETRGREDVQADFQERDWHEDEDQIVLEERTPSGDWRHLDVRWVILKGGQRNELSFSLRLYSSLELKSMMNQVGFRDIDVRGGLDGSPYDDEATRLVIIGTKPA